MKKSINAIIAITLVSFLFNCSEMEYNEKDNYPTNTTDNEFAVNAISTISYVINSSPNNPICPTENPGFNSTQDVQIQFSTTLPQDVQLNLALYKYDKLKKRYYQMISPYPLVIVRKGQRNAILNTSCTLPEQVSCGSYTEYKSQKFKIVVTGYSTTGGVSIVPSINNYFEMYAYKYCVGGSWGEDGPGPSIPNFGSGN